MSVRSPRTFRLLVPPVRLVFLSVIACLVLSTPAAAQDRASRWGVRASFTPNWELHDSIKIFDEDEEGTLKGTEFSIGFVRGSSAGGDWGVSFVRKPFDDESGSIRLDQDCFNQAQTICRPNTEVMRFDGVYLNAFEIHWFKPFVTIARRVQIGLNVGGGLGSFNGNIVTITDRFEPTGFNQNGPTGFVPVHEEEVNLAKDEILPVFPLFKLEAEGAVTVAPGLKIKVAGGVNFPAVGFRAGVVYLFGAQ